MKKNVKQYNFIKGMILSVLLFMLSTNTFGVDFKVGEFYFNILSEADLTVELTAPNYHGYYQGDIVIPEFVTYNKKKYRVVSLDEKSFSGCNFLNSLIIPRSVTSISASFSDCFRITSVTLHCKKVTDYMFHEKESLKKVVIGEEVESIGEKAFWHCPNLNSLTIANGVKSIGKHAFDQCIDLTSVTIPGSVETIGVEAFSGCVNLTNLVISEGVKTICSFAFSDCRRLSSVKIPNSVALIAPGAFQRCPIYSVNLPIHLASDPYIKNAFLNPSIKIIRGRGIELDGTGPERLELANNYYYGKGMPKNQEKAFNMYVRLADEGYSKAKENLIDMYLNGIGTQKDINKALDLMIDQALKGAVDDQYKLMRHKAELLSASNKNVLCAKLVKTYDAEHSKMDANQDWAAFICELAATSGNVHAMYEMGQRRMEGKGCYKDIEKAIRYYEQAANKGNQEAMLALGEIYLNSLLGHFDEPKAIEWFTKAYESGNRVAKEKLGYFYINGIHVKKNKKLGKKILAE